VDEAGNTLARASRRSTQSSLRAAPFTKGELVADRYKILALVGSTGVGAVFRARDEVRGEIVALKTIATNLLQTAEEQKTFARALKGAKKLNHPNIVRVFDVGHVGPRRYFTMEFLEGLTLRKIINLRHEKMQSFTPQEVLPIFQHMASALDYAHKSTWHGDLKPENIIVLPELLKITDFNLVKGLPLKPFLGIAKSRSRGFPYVGPELRMESTHMDGRTDVYSMGVILMEMITGHVFEGHFTRTMSAALEQLPTKLESLIRRALSEHPDGRFVKAGELVKALHRAMKDLPGGKLPAPNTLTDKKRPPTRAKSRVPSQRRSAPPTPPPAETAADLESLPSRDPTVGSSPSGSLPEIGQSQVLLLDGEGGAAASAFTTENEPLGDGSEVHALEQAKRIKALLRSEVSDEAVESETIQDQLDANDVQADSLIAELEADSLPDEPPVSMPESLHDEEPLGRAGSLEGLSASLPKMTESDLADEFSDSEVDTADIKRGIGEDDATPALAPGDPGPKQISFDEEPPSVGPLVPPPLPNEIVEASQSGSLSGEGLLETPPPETTTGQGGSGRDIHEELTDVKAHPRPDLLDVFDKADEQEPTAARPPKFSTVSEEPPREFNNSVAEAETRTVARNPSLAQGPDAADDEWEENSVPRMRPPILTPQGSGEMISSAPQPTLRPVVPPIRRRKSAAPLYLAVFLITLVLTVVVFFALQSLFIDGKKDSSGGKGPAVVTPEDPVEKPKDPTPPVATPDAGSAVALASTPDSGSTASAMNPVAPSAAPDAGPAVIPEKGSDGEKAKTTPDPVVIKKPRDDRDVEEKLRREMQQREERERKRLEAQRKKEEEAEKAAEAKKTREEEAAAKTAAKGDDLQCPVKGMVLVKGGSFKMGSSGADPMRNFGELSHRSVTTNAYCIDYYETPNSSRRKPVTGVTWSRAKSACETRGKRLCTEAEWEKACKGPAGYRFPYGNRYDADRCNTEDENGNSRELGTARDFGKCRSGYGLFNMSGNAEEWTADSYSAGSNKRVAKGGATNRPDWASRCAARRAQNPRSSSPTLGFRCCADPQ
jgi:serine/threonine protein kinase/formylglycine-generating enzyme required for sulfatase activity